MKNEDPEAIPKQQEDAKLPVKEDDSLSVPKPPSQNGSANTFQVPTDSSTAAPEDTSTDPKKEEILSEMHLSKILKLNVPSIDFGELLPGQILEENLIIMNCLQTSKIPFKIKVNCLTKEFDELDEYVYSMRRPTNNESYNYNDTFLILLTSKSVSYYKVAIKVPNVKEEKEVLGSIELSSNECQGIITIPIKAKVLVPAVKCEKMITLKSIGLPVVKLYMKTPKRQDFRINLKNMCKLGLVAELYVTKNEEELKCMDFSFYPQSVNLPSMTPINFTMSAKCISNENEILNREIHVVLIVKIKSSSAIFSYPIVILIGDGKPEGKVFA